MVQNIPEYSVSELAGSVRRTLEGAFGLVRVRGEISGFKAYASGHGYFDLKDMDAVIAGVMWKGNLMRLSFRPENGLEVIATGKISAYPKSSKYQLIVERMEVAGIGAILKQIEERRKKLQAEGLFDRAAKPRPPFIPRHIGVVTSAQGAVFRDILHRLADRFPRRVTLWPVPVQGDGAGAKIAAAIIGFNAMPADRRPDLLIVGRGGGSVEDLMPFNDEVVVRAAAASRIPLISAVGHETDTTLIDYAAAIRAPTPTAAAELAVPVRAELIEQLADLGLRARRGERHARRRMGERLDALSARLPRPAALAAIPRQRLDEAGVRLPRALAQRLRLERERLAGLRLPRPAALLPPYRQRFRALADRAAPRLLRDLVARDRALLNSPRHTASPALLKARLAAAQDRLAATFRLVESLSPQAVMARGFVLVTLPDGSIARHRQQAEAAGHFTLTFADGALPAFAGKPAKPAEDSTEKTGQKPKPAPSSPRQGSLL